MPEEGKCVSVARVTSGTPALGGWVSCNMQTWVASPRLVLVLVMHREGTHVLKVLLAIFYMNKESNDYIIKKVQYNFKSIELPFYPLEWESVSKLLTQSGTNSPASAVPQSFVELFSVFQLVVLVLWLTSVTGLSVNKFDNWKYFNLFM